MDMPPGIAMEPWWRRKARQTCAANSNIAAQSIAGMYRTDHHLAVLKLWPRPTATRARWWLPVCAGSNLYAGLHSAA